MVIRHRDIVKREGAVIQAFEITVARTDRT